MSDPVSSYKRFVGEGWHSLLDDLHAALIEVDPDYEVLQVKEKFGGLRVYITGSHEAHDICHKFEAKSYEICEMCGKPGKLDESHPWIKTLCPDHVVTMDEEWKKWKERNE